MTSDAQSPYGLSKDFQWSSGRAVLLATTVVSLTGAQKDDHTEWEQLREMIKYKIEQNITLFLAENICGNLRLPPFPPRKRNELSPHEAPKVHMDQDEATDVKSLIFRQLHEFDDKPPFTIQRVCELCVSPNHPKHGFSTATLSFGPSTQSVPTTPLFSPIPFLHDDPRRSNSRSPPPSPLTLAAMEGMGNIDLLNETMSQRAIGLVDELDNPSPGHMSDHPTAISSVTTVESRSVRGYEEQMAIESESGMAVDEADDKENKG
ncbi:hypothetical protein BU15DRAFT_87618 [Melanogaster broomeanus]|nr:hypothetical protein BU15DRAFT_87618 [Melanogaster broomeanus]